MQNFEFQNPTKIIFGRDAEEKLPALLKAYGKRVLLHYGGGSIKKNGVYEKVKRQLGLAGAEVFELGGVQPNPRLNLIYEGIELCRKNGIEFVLAVGGGSVIDSAKGIAVGVPYSGDVWDFYTGAAVPETKLPVASYSRYPRRGANRASAAS
jgi:alcohol dehydrogenase YqhD (iron-dependent ADH family)